MHSKVKELNPVITYKLGYETYGGQSINIVLPYATFNLQAKFPIYPNATNYFPIRRASNETQYVIGRTFLQEAYIIVNYERSNFSVFQASFPEDGASNIVPTHPVESRGHHSFLTTGFKIGIAVVATAMLALLAGSCFGYRYKRKCLKWLQLRQPKKPATAKHENQGEEVRRNEMPHNVIEEVSGLSLYPEMDTGMVPEIDDEEIMVELPQPVVYEVSGVSCVSAQTQENIPE